KLQLLRTNMKLSQEELANRLDISRQSITKWENGVSHN
ncbi:MAG: helix-turn-helix transcriptional regulator, partial [Lachnospiraceae bacterium]|nr:helix-turn-helix transcriptional regulator [Lachnospiraceae bacterium]